MQNKPDTGLAFLGMPIAMAITIFWLIFFCRAACPQTIGETQLGVQEIELSMNRGRVDTVVVVGTEIAFKFPADSKRIASLWGAWPGIGHVSMQDVSIMDERCVLRLYPRYSQIVYFSVWFPDYAFPVMSREYFIVVLAMPPLLDMNEDGVVNVRDRERLKSLLDTRSADKKYQHDFDFNNDGWIDRIDWLVFEQAK
jgi:hypothetical protein